MVDAEAKKFYDRIIFKKYKIKRLMCKSILSYVYEGINIKNNIPVAIKVEKKGKYELLETEAYLLMNLKGFGIPEILSFGKYCNYKVLVEELLGPTVEDLWKKSAFKKDRLGKKNMFIKDVCMLAIQGLDRLEFIHSKNIIHRDIKTKNFIIGRKDPNIIYLIDFGFSKKYRSSRTGKHLKFSYINTLIGSVCFSSRYAIRGYELSRRDDLESFGYMILYLAKGGNLPWMKYYNKKDTDRFKRIDEIAKQKMEISNEKLCAGLPFEFANYMKYVKNLEFEQNPDYKYLKGLFINILTTNEMRRNIQFFWIKPKIKKKNELNTNNIIDTNSLLKKLGSNKRNSNHSLKRIYNKIKSSLSQKCRNNTDYNVYVGNKLTIESDRNLATEITEYKTNIQNIKKNIKYPMALYNKHLIKDIKKSFKIGNEIRKKSPNIIALKYKNALNNKLLLGNNILNKNIYNQVKIKNNINNTINVVRNKLKSKYTGFDKGITLYNNMNYNNLYFINNNHSGLNYSALNKRNFLMKNKTSNFKTFNSINNINLKRNIRYHPIFKNNMITNINKVNRISNNFVNPRVIKTKM